MSAFRRSVKNVVKNYKPSERMVRDATSNDAWGAPSTLLSKIADSTHDVEQFTQIMAMIWKRVHDSGKNWRHVYKSLVLVEYLMKNGADHVCDDVRSNLFAVQSLREFKYEDKDGKDQGLNVREKAKTIINLLEDPERMNDERQRAQMARQRVQSANALPIGGQASRGPNSQARAAQAAAAEAEELELAKQVSMMEAQENVSQEDRMMQMALEISQQEANESADDRQLRLALEASRREAGMPAQTADPWGAPTRRGPPASQGFSADPWGAPPAAAAGPVAADDPWGGGAASTSSGGGGFQQGFGGDAFGTPPAAAATTTQGFHTSEADAFAASFGAASQPPAAAMAVEPPSPATQAFQDQQAFVQAMAAAAQQNKSAPRARAAPDTSAADEKANQRYYEVSVNNPFFMS